MAFHSARVPFYLAAAGLTLREALAWTYRVVDRLRTGANLGPPAFVRPTARALLIASSVTITLAVLLWVLPFRAIREGDRRGVRGGNAADDLRDSVVFVAGGWGQMESGCLQSGALVTRVLLPLGATDTVRAQLHVVAARSAAPGERVEVRVGGQTLGVALLLADNRNQWVDVVVPPDSIRPAADPPLPGLRVLGRCGT